MTRRAAPRYGTGAQPFGVNALLDTYEGPAWVRRHLRGSSGWLKVSRARLETPFSSWSTTLVAGVTDDGARLSKTAAHAFFEMTCAGPMETDDYPPEDELDEITEVLFDGFRGGCDVRHLRLLKEDEEERHQRIHAMQARGERVLADADSFIAALRRERRNPATSQARREQLTSTIAHFEEKQQAAGAWLVQRLKGIRDSGQQFETDVLESLENPGEIEELYCVRFIARSRYERVADHHTLSHLFQVAQHAGAPVSRRIDADERREIEDRRLRMRYPSPAAPAQRAAQVEFVAIRETPEFRAREISEGKREADLNEARERLRAEAQHRIEKRNNYKHRSTSQSMSEQRQASDDNRSEWRREEAQLLAELEDWQSRKAQRRRERLHRRSSSAPTDTAPRANQSLLPVKRMDQADAAKSAEAPPLALARVAGSWGACAVSVPWFSAQLRAWTDQGSHTGRAL